MILLPLSLALVLNSLACLGVHCLTREGMLFEKLRNLIHWLLWSFFYWICVNINKKRLPFFKMNAQKIANYLCKPLFDCPPCMASVWGLIGWFYFVTDLHLIPYLLILCGLNALMSKMFYYGD